MDFSIQYKLWRLIAMIREIVRDEKFLAQKSAAASFMDMSVAQDLLDTLAAHSDRCVGLAANMIGVQKRIIAINLGPMNVAMFNPVIVKKSGKYMTEEGCLSLEGERMTARYQKIVVEYQDMNFKKQRQTFTDFPAQIIQHEIDHCEGIII